MGKSVLVIDDDKLMRSFLVSVLREEGYAVEEAEDGKSGLDLYGKGLFDLVITDMKMPDMSGIDVIKKGLVLKSDTQWIIITAFGSIDSAVDAMKAGASDYLTKPLKSPDELRHVVNRVFREKKAKETIALLAEELDKRFPPLDLIFIGEKMEQVHSLVRDVAPTTASVLLAGASGTGKELIAHVIHQLSPRKDKPFIAVHCASLADTLLESELFGHEKGSFTGAVSLRKGRFEMADGSTIFLDEIGEVSPSMQVKLLRVIQERTFERVGGTKPITVDIRIIAATNKNLKTEVDAGRFREDLYYRLNVFPIDLPALAERKGAIIPLANYFTKRSAVSIGKKEIDLTPAAEKKLQAYTWPGNIRELQNIIERAVILARDRIDAHHLNLETHEEAGEKGEGLLKVKEKEMIKKVLADTAGNREKAAKLLGISRRTLQYRIKEYGW